MDLEKIKSKIITVQGQQMILDSDIADLYQVETKCINEAVKNNPDKFPEGYIITMTDDEMRSLRSKISTLENIGQGKHTKHNAKYFSERGLYMLATILKSPVATERTIEIIETFAKVREVSRIIAEIGQDPDKEIQRGYIKIIQEEGKAPLVEMQLVNNNLWLCKYDFTKLFHCFPQKIEMNLRSIFKNKLLWEEDVTYMYRYTYKGQERQAVYYNLEVLIFLSYRIATFEAKIFRQFINSALREHLQKKENKNDTKLFWYFKQNQSYWLS